MLKRTVSGITLTLLLIGMLTLAFNIQPVETEHITIVVPDDYPMIQEGDVEPFNLTNVFAFYYPWYGTPSVSGYWFHWNDENHNPDIIVDGRRQIAAKHYPVLDVYDSNNESLIRKHIEIAKMANIDCFVVSWWGIGSFEDNALFHIRNVCEQNDFKFTIYYETTSGVGNTVNDILYLLNKYADNSSWYTINDRPVIYVYGRALHQLSPKMWKIGGRDPHWSLFEDIRKPLRNGIFVIHPEEAGVGYVESYDILLKPNETYSLKTGISNMRDDCPPHSDVGFRIKIKNETKGWETLDDLVVNFNDGWLDLSYNISSHAGQTVSVRVESYAGGVMEWCSEWAAVDYFYIINSKGEILNQEPYFDNEWKTVVKTLNESGYNPYFIMDFGGYEYKVEDFAEYFLNFTDGMHIYNPVALSMSDISEIYNKASNAAHSKNRFFVATVMPGYDDTEIRSPGYLVDRENGSYYKSFWSTAKSSFPDHYVITSFNEWHEGTEIEPSLEHGYQYINITKIMSTTWTVDDDGPADFYTIQEAINAANPGDTIYVYNGTYYENVVVNKRVSLIGEDKVTTTVDGNMTATVVAVTADNVTISEFTVRNGGDRYAGISLSSNGNNITNNILWNNWCGINLERYTSYNLIVNNSITNNLNGVHGELWCDSTIVGNDIMDNLLGIWVGPYSMRNTIVSNNIRNNWDAGVSMWQSSYNTIVGNNITDNNQAGVFCGIVVGFSSYNEFFHNNIVNKGKQIDVQGEVVNTWDDGYPSGGNYWSDYKEKYPEASEIDGSGIWDTPYVIDENNQDNYPLTNPWTPAPPTPPVVTATIDINPDTLNLKSRGKWITVYIELPESYDVNNIDITTILLNDTVPAEWSKVKKTRMMVKFDRAEIISYVLANVDMTELYQERFMTITLTITGYLNDGTPFQGSDTIRIILCMPRGIGRHIFPI